MAKNRPPRQFDEWHPQPPAPRKPSRVEKLMALAESSNEHEAALAKQRAAELLEQHNGRRTDGGHGDNSDG